MRETGKLPHNHEVIFYQNDAALVESVANFISSALIAGNAAIVFATKQHRDEFLQALRLTDIDIDRAISEGSYVSVDAGEVLSMFMVNGWPDRARFFQGFSRLIDDVLRAAKAPNPRVAVFGEGVTLLCDQGEIGAAIQLEQLGNDLSDKFDVDILCAYPLSLCTPQREYAIKQIAAEHSAVHSQ